MSDSWTLTGNAAYGCKFLGGLLHATQQLEAKLHMKDGPLQPRKGTYWQLVMTLAPVFVETQRKVDGAVVPGRV